MSSASLHGGIVQGEKYCDILYWLLQNEIIHFINAELFQLTLLDQTDFYAFKIASPLSSLFFNSSRDKEKTKWETELIKSSHRMCPVALQIQHWSGQHHHLRNRGFVSGSASPWAITASDMNDTEMHLPSLIFWLTRWSSNWGWNIYERESWGAENPEMYYLLHVLYSLFMGNSFKFCPSVGWSGSEVTSPKQPELLQICVAVVDGRICLGALYISCVSQGSLCLELRVSPASLIFTSCPCKATCECVYRSSMIISYSSGWLTCRKWMSFFRPLFLQVLLV